MDYFITEEEQNGFRMTWNALPASSALAAKYAIPNALHYNLHFDIERQPLEMMPQRCECKAVLAPIHIVDFKTNSWVCAFCNKRNRLTEASNQQHMVSTLDFLLPCKNPVPFLMLLVDLCLPEEELAGLKQGLLEALKQVAPDTAMGLLTIGRNVSVYNLREDIATRLIFGSKIISPDQARQALGLLTQQSVRAKYLRPMAEVKDKLADIIAGLKAEPAEALINRQVRLTGQALHLATSIAEFDEGTGELLVFLAGPCTGGPGQTVEQSLTSIMRSFDDILRGQNIGFFDKASMYYKEIASRLVAKQACCSMVVFTLDQFGLVEMSDLLNSTGGVLVMGEEFSSDSYFTNVVQLLNNKNSASQGVVQIFMSSNLAVQGAVGACSSLGKKAPWVSKNTVGKGDTCNWFVGKINTSRSLSFYFESELKTARPNVAIQIQTISRIGSHYRLRITSIGRQVAPMEGPTQSPEKMIAGFDQEAAVLALARLGVDRFKELPTREVIKWLDRTLVKFAKQFSQYVKNNAASYKLAKEAALLPQFLYHLRRSPFVNVLGMSPDEQQYYRLSLHRESIANSLTMVQPTLHQYKAQDPNPTPVSLDAGSMKEAVILLFDSYFVVLEWLGPHVKSWMDQGLAADPEYAHLKEFFESPAVDIAEIISTRLPVPLQHQTWSGHPKERLLKSRVNPSVIQEISEENQNFYTDEISLRQFMEVLVKLTVKD